MSATGIICYSSVKITTSDNFKSKYPHGQTHTDNSDVDGDLLMLIVIDFDFQLPQIYEQFGRLLWLRQPPPIYFRNTVLRCIAMYTLHLHIVFVNMRA